MSSKDKVLSMLHNLTDKSSKCDVFMRFFESLFDCPCVLALYRENALLKFSRCRGQLYAAIDGFKPVDFKETMGTSGGIYILDEQNRPSKLVGTCSEDKLKGKIMVISFKRSKVSEPGESSPSSPSSPSKRNLNRGTFLFLELSKVNLITTLFAHLEQKDDERLQLSNFFSKVEKEFLSKIDSK